MRFFHQFDGFDASFLAHGKSIYAGDLRKSGWKNWLQRRYSVYHLGGGTLHSALPS